MLAVAALASCMKEQTIATQQPGAIAFDNVILDKATRAAAVDPSYTSDNLKAFDVWAFMDETSGKVFVGEDVKFNGSEWTYSNTQYWMPNKTYYFAALAPMNSVNWSLDAEAAGVNGAGVVTFTNVDGSEDLVYAATTRMTPAAVTEAQAKVKFQFNHLLSKVKFTFKNGFANNNISVKITDVKITNAPKTGTINLNVENWWDNDDWTLGAGVVPLAFGDVELLAFAGKEESADERLTIPASADKSYNVTFTVEVFMGNVSAMSKDVDVDITGVALEMGKAYNFTATIDGSTEDLQLFPIEFDIVEVKDWVTAETPNEQVAQAEFLAAIQLGGDVVLASDVVVAEALHVQNNLNINLNGNTLKYTGNDVLFRVENGAVVTIDGSAEGSAIVTKPTTMAGASAGNGYVALVKDGTLNIYGGEYDAQATCTIAQVSNGTLNVYGGTFKVNTDEYTDANGNAAYLLNCSDAAYKNKTAVINVYGGTFYKFNPANNAAEGNGTNFCPVGYTAEVDGDIYTVATAPVKVSGVVDYNNATLEVVVAPENTASTYGIVCPEGETTIKNLTIDGNNLNTTNNKGLRGIYITKGGEYTLENVVIKNVLYAINVNTTQAVKLNVNGCTLEGWTSHGASTEATYTNVKFECGKYANLKPYGNTTLTNCSFEDGFMIDFTAMVDGAKITLENCTYNGVVLTAANFASVAKIDGEFTGKVNF